MKSYSATVSSKGQLVIPAELRQELGIAAGARVDFLWDGERLVLDPQSLTAKLRKIDRACGITAGGASGADLLTEERRREREREARERGW